MLNEQQVLLVKMALHKGYLSSQQAASILSARAQPSFSFQDYLRRVLSEKQLQEILQLVQRESTGLDSTDAIKNLTAPTLQQLGRYKIIEKLGQGGMGTVYKCWDPLLQRTIALKTLITQGSEQLLQRFLVEMRATVQLRHPNIVRVYEVGMEQGIYFYTMEHLEGTSLHSLIQDKKLGLKKGISLIKKIANALEYAHQQGIIHRDLKPANIVVNAEQEPFLLDFGLAKEIGTNNQITESGAVLGTPQYMSPEQAQGNIRAIDVRTDTYALGVLLYEIITGKLPFYGKNRVELQVKIVEKDPPLPSSVNRRIPKDLDAICKKALAKNKLQRYASAADLVSDIERWEQGQPTIARKEVGTIPRYVWGILGGIVGIVGILGWLYMSAPQTKPTTIPQDKTPQHTTQTTQQQQQKLWKDKLTQYYTPHNAELDLDKQPTTEEELGFYLQNISHLSSVKIDNTNIKGASFVHFKRFQNTLLRLDLKGLPISNDALIHFRDFKVLERVDLEKTSIDNDGLAHLSHLDSLLSLDLSETKITGTGLVHLKNLHKLGRLALEHDDIDSAALENISHLYNMQRLNLSYTKIDNSALRFLINMRYLEALDLKGTLVNDSAISYLRNLTSLRELELKESKMTLQGAREINRLLPRCKVYY